MENIYIQVQAPSYSKRGYWDNGMTTGHWLLHAVISMPGCILGGCRTRTEQDKTPSDNVPRFVIYSFIVLFFDVVQCSLCSFDYKQLAVQTYSYLITCGSQCKSQMNTLMLYMLNVV